jgi:hypothetical protein
MTISPACATLLIPECESRLSLEKHEDLLLGVLMLGRAAAGWSVDEDQRDTHAVVAALELA